MKQDALETMFKFVEEPDPEKAYVLLMDALAVEFQRVCDEETGEPVSVFTETLPKVSIVKRYECELPEDGINGQSTESLQGIVRVALMDAAKKAQQRIRKIISDGTEDINLDLGAVTSFVTQHNEKFSTHFILDGWVNIKADDIVFAFVLLVEQSDHARCKHCGKLFIGTRGGRKEHCTESCRVARFQKNKRAAAKKKKG